jgi:hypothetical protein
VGDWSGDKVADLRLVEHGLPVIREIHDGSVLAVGSRGYVHATVDLTGDGLKELAVLQSGRLRMLMYAHGAGLVDDQEGPAVRVDDPEAVHIREAGAEDAFDKRGLPAPAVMLLLVLLASTVGWMRRRQRRARG